MKGRGKEEREGEVRGGEGGSLSFALGRKKRKVGAYDTNCRRSRMSVRPTSSPSLLTLTLTIYLDL